MSYRDLIKQVTIEEYDLLLEKFPVDEIFIRVVKNGDLIVSNLHQYRCYNCLNSKKYLQIVPITESYWFQEYENAEILLCDDCREQMKMKREKFDKKWSKYEKIQENDCIETIDFDITEKDLIQSLASFQIRCVINETEIDAFFEQTSDIFKKNVLNFFDMICDMLLPDSSLNVCIKNFQYLNDKLTLIWKKLKYFNISLHQFYYLLTNKELPDHLILKFTNKMQSSRPFVSSFPSDGHLKISKSITKIFDVVSYKYSSVLQQNRFLAGNMFVTDVYCTDINSDDNLRVGMVLEPLSTNYLVIFTNGQFDYIPHYYLKYCDLDWTMVFKPASHSRMILHSFLREYPTKFFAKIETGKFYKIFFNNTEVISKILKINKSIGLIKYKNNQIESIVPLAEYFKPIDLNNDEISVIKRRKAPPHLFGQTKRFELDTDIYSNEVTNIRKRKCTVCMKSYDKVSIIKKANLYKVSIFVIPEVYGWKRRVTNNRVFYFSPCQKEFRKLGDIRNHIWQTNELVIEYFTFEPKIKIERRIIFEKKQLQNIDLSCKTEYYPISVINEVDKETLKLFLYSTTIMNNISHITFNNEFKTNCNCENDCLIQNKCSCRMLTVNQAVDFYKKLNIHIDSTMLGYQFKLLYDAVQTGIFECNSNCKCSSKCVNRLVQYPTKIHLQVFKTSQCGWGVRILHDVPEGSFLGVYTGELLYGHAANTLELVTEDTYLADLDFIEVVEGMKEDYEKEYGDAMKRKKMKMNKNELDRVKSVRELYNENTPYAIDGKKTGNIGRFFNHSCDPNLFVQNVFIETHDLRFPHVAFFAAKNLKAGQELTWDYSYEVDSIPGKHIDCKCGSQNCRKRLI